MPNYLLAYHGGRMPRSRTEQAKLMNAWTAWMKGLGHLLG